MDLCTNTIHVPEFLLIFWTMMTVMPRSSHNYGGPTTPLTTVCDLHLLLVSVEGSMVCSRRLGRIYSHDNCRRSFLSRFSLIFATGSSLALSWSSSAVWVSRWSRLCKCCPLLQPPILNIPRCICYGAAIRWSFGMASSEEHHNV